MVITKKKMNEIISKFEETTKKLEDKIIHLEGVVKELKYEIIELQKIKENEQTITPEQILSEYLMGDPNAKKTRRV